MFRLALLLALESRAQTPTRPIGSALAIIGVIYVIQNVKFFRDLWQTNIAHCYWG